MRLGLSSSVDALCQDEMMHTPPPAFNRLPSPDDNDLPPQRITAHHVRGLAQEMRQRSFASFPVPVPMPGVVQRRPCANRCGPPSHFDIHRALRPAQLGRLASIQIGPFRPSHAQAPLTTTTVTGGIEL
ncbi:hypothetical protein BD309DRAFT_967786 [Dichomitus squalens]|nr:hypothetical protein BD309DRAFT_967786 [Dichomitus squalens]